MEIHHYTRASTLPLILGTRTIRFTRADLLDDASEVPIKNQHIDARYFYVSSWTLQSNEQSGQWHRYGDASRGVRISFHESPFEWENVSVLIRREVAGDPGEDHLEDVRSVGIRVDGVDVPYPSSSMFGNGYILIPDGSGTRREFGCAVTYVDNVELEAAKYCISDNGKTTIYGSASNVARIKASAWADQEEYRYVLMAVAGPEKTYVESPSVYEAELLDSIESRGVVPFPPAKVGHIDIPLSLDAFEKMTVTLGPLISREDTEKVLEALKLLAPKAIIKFSAINLR